FLPLDLGSIKGFATKFQLYTVPGQVYYNATRKLVLRGVDGVVFVADSQRDKMQENIDSLKNLQENLKEYGIDLGSVPFVLQYNKRDLPGVATIVELDQQLNWFKVPTFEAQAHQGVGVFTTLKAIGKIVIDTFNAKYSARQSSRRPSSLPEAQTAPPPQAAPAPIPQRPMAPPPPQQAAAPAPRPMAPQAPPMVPPLAPPPRPSMPPPPAAVPGLQPGFAAPVPPRPAMPPIPPPQPAAAPIPAPYPTSPAGAPQYAGFNPPATGSQPAFQQVPGLQTDYFGTPAPAPAPSPVPGFQSNPVPMQPPVQQTQVPGLQGFAAPAALPPSPPSAHSSSHAAPSPGSHGSAPSQPDRPQKKSKLDGSIDPSDLDAEIARYERELADQKAQIVSNPNVNPNLQSQDPLASAFLTPEELNKLQGSDSYPTRRMPLGPGQH
ncbi:MAG TPA: GTPase domain-containing protein, partial [Fibrobacteria bacterium]|nr:GTPase domain-containing protein [Fibrobacteria bacterium]